MTIERGRHIWDQGAIKEGVALVSAALARGSVGEYQLQAAIAALHDEAASRVPVPRGGGQDDEHAGAE